MTHNALIISPEADIDRRYQVFCAGCGYTQTHRFIFDATNDRDTHNQEQA